MRPTGDLLISFFGCSLIAFAALKNWLFLNPFCNLIGDAIPIHRPGQEVSPAQPD
jgi:hypothetical protein